MSTSKQLNQLDAARLLLEKFALQDTPSNAATAIFPARVIEDSQKNASEVNAFLAKVKQQRDASHMYRLLQVEVTRARDHDLQRTDSALKFLFSCRKSRFNRDKGDVSLTEMDNVHQTPPSPFTRRTFNRDPIHKVKEEPLTPVTVVSQASNRSRTQIRSNSSLTGLSYPSNPSLHPESVGSAAKTSASNPLYFNINQGTPLRPGHRMKEELMTPKSEPATRLQQKPPPYPGKPLYARMGTPPSVPMEPFCRELRGALQGIGGMYFIPDGRGHLVVSTTCAINEALELAVQPLLKLGNWFMDIKRGVKRYSGGGMTRTAVVDAIDIALDDYLTDVGDIPIKTVNRNGFEQLISGTRPWHTRLAVLRRCVNVLHEPNLVLQEDVYALWLSSRGTEAEAVMRTVLSATLSVFCSELRSWINHGELLSDRWIIQESNDIFEVVHLPEFTRGISLQNVLKIGTSGSFIKGDDALRLEQFQLLLETHVVPENFFTDDGRSKIDGTISAMADWVGRKVVDRLLSEGHLVEYLDAARRYLLLDDQPFCLALHKCIQTMAHRGPSLSRDDALTAFVSAIKQSPAANAFPFRVTVDTLVNTNSYPLASARSQFIQSVHPVLSVTGIAEKVFKDSQSRYETLFHFIWSIQTALLNTEDVAYRLRHIRQELRRHPEASKLHRLASAICTRLLRVLLATRQYTLVIISQCSSRFRARLDEINDIDSMAKQHISYLEETTSLLFCDPEMEKILAHLMKICKIAYSFSKEIIRFEQEIDALEQNVSQEASESIIEFERAEQSISLAPIKNEMLTMSKIFKAVSDDFQSQLLEAKEKTPLLSIILQSFPGNHL